MSGITSPSPFSDSFWSEPSSSGKTPLSHLSFGSKRNNDLVIKEFLSSVDEAPDFHDPYSDLNLFLSQKIKKEMEKHGFGKKWCSKIQDELIQNVSPEFQQKFPQYRLGISALRKTWEKIAYFSQQIYNKKEALTEEGKLNISFFIKENLKQYPQLKNPYNLQPYHYAHQVAMKMSECIATIDGIRIKMDHLTTMIWSVQRHLLNGSSIHHLKSPYDEYDKIDKLIVKTILEITAENPAISQKELESQVKETLKSLHDLPSCASMEKMTCNVSALLAEKLYASSPFHMIFFSEQKNAISNFIRRQIDFGKVSIPTSELRELVRRILALYTLASQMPKNLKEKEIKAAIEATYPILKEDRPVLSQSIYAFISAESVLMKNEQYCHSTDYVIETIFQAYQEAKLLPELNGKGLDFIEVMIWKSLSETECLLEKLPYRIGHRIDQEIANILIDNPYQSFASTVHSTLQFFRKTKELAFYKKGNEIERKIHNWSLQADMLCRSIRIDIETPLFKIIRQRWEETKAQKKTLSHMEFINDIAQNYLKQHLELSPYTPQLLVRIWTLYKYFWYNMLAKEEESSFDRFILWHAGFLVNSSCPQETNYSIQQLEELCQKTLPLIPFDASHINQLLFKKE